MSEFVLDASALLALLNGEAGANRVAELLPRARIGSVNFSETIAKLIERGVVDFKIEAILHEFDRMIVPFDVVQATVAGKLRATTRAAGLSLGDRACLALALHSGATAVTADRAWNRIELGVTIELLR